MFIFRDFKGVQSKSNQISEVYRYSNCYYFFFFCLVKEKGPVPLKVGLIVVEVGWCPCTVQSLYPLLFVELCVCVCECVYVTVCVYGHAGACMHVHISRNLLTASVRPIQKTFELKSLGFIKDTSAFSRTRR